MLIYINQIEMSMGGRKLKNPEPLSNQKFILFVGVWLDNFHLICRSYRNTFEAHLRILRWKAEGKLQNISLSY